MASTFPVAQRGIGRPDYSPEIAPAQDVIGVNQERWGVYGSVNIAGGFFNTVTLYTVAANRQLYFLSAMVNCSASGIQRFDLQYIDASGTSYTVGIFRFDVAKDLNLVRPMIVPPGGRLNISIYNFDTVLRNFTFTLIGSLERIV